jgi:hypothetical protein
VRGRPAPAQQAEFSTPPTTVITDRQSRHCGSPFPDHNICYSRSPVDATSLASQCQFRSVLDSLPTDSGSILLPCSGSVLVHELPPLAIDANTIRGWSQARRSSGFYCGHARRWVLGPMQCGTLGVICQLVREVLSRFSKIIIPIPAISSAISPAPSRDLHCRDVPHRWPGPGQIRLEAR